MRLARDVPLAVGGLLFAFGLAIVIDPAVASLVPMGAAVSALGHDYLLAAAVGTLAATVALAVMGQRARRGFDQATPPTAEDVPTGVPLGRDVDRVVRDDLYPHEHLLGDVRTRVRERVRRAAIETLQRTERCSREAARERVESGAWTDDAVAASFLTESEGPPTDRLLDALPGRSRFGRRAERAVRAVLARDEREGGR